VAFGTTENCSPGCHVCTLAEWLERPRDAMAPTSHFWTATPFYLNAATADGNCYAGWNEGGVSCKGPAKVCAEVRTDDRNNQCQYFGCGFSTEQPNHHLGGCGVNDATGGVLCCCF
jgi:hypothetical protein